MAQTILKVFFLNRLWFPQCLIPLCKYVCFQRSINPPGIFLVLVYILSRAVPQITRLIFLSGGHSWYLFGFRLCSRSTAVPQITPQPSKIFSLILFNHMHNSFLYTRTKILNQLGAKSKLEPRPFFLSKHRKRFFGVVSFFTIGVIFSSSRDFSFLFQLESFFFQRIQILALRESGREEKSRTRRVHVAN